MRDYTEEESRSERLWLKPVKEGDLHTTVMYNIYKLTNLKLAVT